MAFSLDGFMFDKYDKERIENACKALRSQAELLYLIFENDDGDDEGHIVNGASSALTMIADRIDQTLEQAAARHAKTVTPARRHAKALAP